MANNEKKSIKDVMVAKWGAFGAITVAVVGLIGTLATAYFGYLAIVTPIQLNPVATQTAISIAPTNTPTSTNTLTPIHTPTLTDTPTPPNTPTPEKFTYPVQVSSKVTGNGIPLAEVSLQVGLAPPFPTVTDVDGFARFSLDSNNLGKSAWLIVRVTNFEIYKKNIDLEELDSPYQVQVSGFLYPVEVRSNASGTIQDAIVAIQVGNNAPKTGVTDSNGYVRIFVDSDYLNKPAFLIVNADGYQENRQEIDLSELIRPNVVQLKLIRIPPTPTPTSTPIPEANIIMENSLEPNNYTFIFGQGAKVCFYLSSPSAAVAFIQDTNGSTQIYEWDFSHPLGPEGDCTEIPMHWTHGWNKLILQIRDNNYAVISSKAVDFRIRSKDQ